MIPYHKLLQHTRWEANPNDLCIAALTNPRAAFLKLSSASTRERLSVESCMLRTCRQHTDLRGSGPISFHCNSTSNFWIFCILAKPAARPRQPLSPRRSDVLGSNPSNPESCIMETGLLFGFRCASCPIDSLQRCASWDFLKFSPPASAPELSCSHLSTTKSLNC